MSDVTTTPVVDSMPALAWDGLSLTKFRAPRQRRGLLLRSALVERAVQSLQRHPVTLVSAPAGFGKSTLLIQLAQTLEPTATVVWLSLDEDDNDLNRFFVSLVSALREQPLQWNVSPRLLASQVQGPGQQTRAAVAAVVNALDSFAGERLILILDDLHCVTDPAALQLLADLIERLPPAISLVLGSRTEPVLPLARWRVRGELGELRHGDLQFDNGEAEALAALRQAEGQAPQLSPAFIAQALQRTQGWAAGLSLVFGVASGPLVEHLQSAVDRAASRHLFDFFAQEVLAELPDDLADFILRCSVLPELNPALCQAVTGRSDAHGVLEDLYRRNLFLTALDETVPVLRFHDLFAEFLQSRLDRLHPGLADKLHARAAEAEQIPLRAVAHWLRAKDWEQAVKAIDRCVEPLLAEGGLTLVERWIGQLPEAWNRRPEVARLQALCASAGWDFERAFGLLEQACAGFRAQGNETEYRRHFALLPRAYNAVGRLLEAERALNQADDLPLELPSRLICDSSRAWQEVAMGRPNGVARALTAIADAVERDPDWLVPAINDLFNSFMFGMPGVLVPIQRLRQLCRTRLDSAGTSWQIEALAYTSWPDFWHGDRVAVREAVERQSAMRTRLSILPALQLNACQAEAWEAAAGGDYARAATLQQELLDTMDQLGVQGLIATWRRCAAHNLAYYHWMARDLKAMQALWPYLAPTSSSVEWPFINTAHAQLRGQLALLENRLDDAEAALLEAETLQQAWPMPTFIGDVRVTLAYLRLQQQQPEQAWNSFLPVLQRCRSEDSIGLLLTAPAFAVDALLALMPDDLRAECRPLLERLHTWRVAPAVETASAPEGPPALRELSAREREVLALMAAGDSNKHIARALDLSPHTVKRHVANILTKLDCSTRGQAAALWRHHQAE